MFPEKWMPLYGMVTFSLIPYAEAMSRSREQDALLERAGYDVVERAISEGRESVEQVVFGGSLSRHVDDI